MRGTRGICTGGGAILAFSVLVGCAQQQAAQSSQAAAQAAANPVQTATNAAGAVVAAATGAVGGAVNGAVTGAAGGAQPKKKPLIVPNGRGGFDSSAAQKDAIRRAHLVSARYGTTKVTRARNGVLAGGPTTRPTTATSNR